jgi:hypothetical protein
MKCNCKGCTDRTLGCHDSCDSYLLFKEDRERVRQSKINDKIYMGYIMKQEDKATRIHFGKISR